MQGADLNSVFDSCNFAVLVLRNVRNQDAKNKAGRVGVEKAENDGRQGGRERVSPLSVSFLLCQNYSLIP